MYIRSNKWYLKLRIDPVSVNVLNYSKYFNNDPVVFVDVSNCSQLKDENALPNNKVGNDSKIGDKNPNYLKK